MKNQNEWRDGTGYKLMYVVCKLLLTSCFRDTLKVSLLFSNRLIHIYIYIHLDWYMYVLYMYRMSRRNPAPPEMYKTPW